MPVIAVNLSPKTYAEIVGLVGQGAYANPEQFLEIAAFNQLALERGLTPEDLKKTLYRPADVGHATEGPLPMKDHPTSGRVAGRRQSNKEPAARRAEVIEISEVELQDVLRRFSFESCARLSLEPAEQVEPGTERVWGQVNRLFPVKAGCRWIAAAAASGAWPDLGSLSERMALDAAILGSSLEKTDAEKARRREEMLGTGLPRKGNLQSTDRFLSQFIARVTRANRIYPGVIAQYGLASLSGSSLQLTRAGIELARLRNPILDDDFRAGLRRRFLKTNGSSCLTI